MNSTPRTSEFKVADCLVQSLRIVGRRPGRAALSMLGTVLGVGALVTTLGVTTTASRQLSDRFDAVRASEVVVQDVAQDPSAPAFPPDASQRLLRIDGVVTAGTLWRTANRRVSRGVSAGSAQVDTTVFAASPEALAAIAPKVTGRVYDSSAEHAGADVAMVGTALAGRLGLDPSAVPQVVFVDEIPLLVVAVIGDVRRRPEVLGAVVVPTSVARRRAWTPDPPGREILVEVRPGAAQVVAAQVPLALNPDAPESVSVLAPPDPRTLRNQVEGDLRRFGLVMAAVMLILGALSIAVAALLGVIERVPELGLRRAAGARPLHIGAQLATESALLGAAGGIIGVSVGVSALVAVSLTQGWRPVVDPVVFVIAPLLGQATGVVAGIAPAIRGARIQPAAALRSG